MGPLDTVSTHYDHLSMPRQPQPCYHPGKKRWRVQVKGVRVWLGSDRAKAFAKFAKIVGSSPDRVSPRTVPELCESWLREHPGEWRAYCLNDWQVQECVTLLADLDHRTLLTLARDSKLRGNEPQTVAHKVRTAARVCRHAVEWGWLAEVPKIPKLARPVRKPRDLSTAELRVFLEALKKPRRRRVGNLARFILATGCRPGEARELQWRSVDIDQGVCRLETSKTGHARSIYLNEDANKTLADADALDGNCGYVFLSRDEKPYTRTGFGAIIKRLGVTQYQLRHTFAQMSLAQLPIEDVAALLGHSDLSTVQTYAQIRSSRLRRAAKSLVSPMTLVQDDDQEPSADAAAS